MKCMPSLHTQLCIDAEIGALVKTIGDDMNKNYTIIATKFHHVQKQSFADEHLGSLSSNGKSVVKDWMPALKSRLD